MKLKDCRAVLWLVACTLGLGGTGLAGDAATIGAKAVWTLPEAAWSACLRRGDNPTGCLERVMQETGASSEALAVTRLLEGEAYMRSFEKMGRVDAAVMVFPLRANTNEVPYCVNGKPLLVSSEIDERDLRLDADPAYAALQKAHPDVMFWATGEGPRRVDALPGGGQGFVFAYPLLQGCHACAVLGHALVSLDFGPDGTYKGPRLLRLEPTQ